MHLRSKACALGLRSRACALGLRSRACAVGTRACPAGITLCAGDAPGYCPSGCVSSFGFDICGS
jgi:hypothetical protein